MYKSLFSLLFCPISFLGYSCAKKRLTVDCSLWIIQAIITALLFKISLI